MSQARTDRILLLVLAVSLGLNMYLGLAALPRRTAPAAQISLGTQMPDIEVQLLNGDPKKISPAVGGSPVLLYVFTTTCPWCQSNRAHIEALAQLLSARFRFVPICLDCQPNQDIPPIAGQHPYIRPSPHTIAAYKMRSVPLTVVLRADGKLQHLWRGAFVGETRNEIERVFGLEFVNE